MTKTGQALVSMCLERSPSATPLSNIPAGERENSDRGNWRKYMGKMENAFYHYFFFL